MRKRERLAYISGIVDNQGSIHILKRKQPDGSYNYALSFVIYHRKRSILEFIQEFFEAGKIYSDRQGFQLRFGADISTKILKSLLPFLILKLEQANLAIEFQTRKEYKTRPLSEQELNFRQSCYERMRELNKKT